MGDALRKVQAGQKLQIPAGAYNAFVDAAIDFKRRSTSTGREPEVAVQDRDVLLVRNDSGKARKRFEILAIDRPIFDPDDNLDEFKNRPSVVGVKPKAAKHQGKFVVLQEPLAPGVIGRAVVSAVTVCRVKVIDPHDDRADVASGKCEYLETSPDGSGLILWREPGKGVKWALVKLGLPCCSDGASGSMSGSGSDGDGSDDGSGDSGDSDESQSSATGSLDSQSSGSGASGGGGGSDETSGSGSGPSGSGSGGSGDVSVSGSGISGSVSNSGGSGSSGSSGSSVEYACGQCFCGHVWNGEAWEEVNSRCGQKGCNEDFDCPDLMPPPFPGIEVGSCFGVTCPAPID